MDENSVNVKCDFCGNDMECPKSMLEKSKKHMCSKCYFLKMKENSFEPMEDVHIDLPSEEIMKNMVENMAEEIVDKLFPEFWEEHKKEFKELSKKELTLIAFDAGVFMALTGVFSFGMHPPDKKDSDKD